MDLLKLFSFLGLNPPMAGGARAPNPYGRKALVGQAVIDGVDRSERINYDRSKKYPHSSARQQSREKRRAGGVR